MTGAPSAPAPSSRAPSAPAPSSPPLSAALTTLARRQWPPLSWLRRDGAPQPPRGMRRPQQHVFLAAAASDWSASPPSATHTGTPARRRAAAATWRRSARSQRVGGGGARDARAATAAAAQLATAVVGAAADEHQHAPHVCRCKLQSACSRFEPESRSAARAAHSHAARRQQQPHAQRSTTAIERRAAHALARRSACAAHNSIRASGARLITSSKGCKCGAARVRIGRRDPRLEGGGRRAHASATVN